MPDPARPIQYTIPDPGTLRRAYAKAVTDKRTAAGLVLVVAAAEIGIALATLWNIEHPEEAMHGMKTATRRRVDAWLGLTIDQVMARYIAWTKTPD